MSVQSLDEMIRERAKAKLNREIEAAMRPLRGFIEANGQFEDEGVCLLSLPVTLCEHGSVDVGECLSVVEKVLFAALIDNHTVQVMKKVLENMLGREPMALCDCEREYDDEEDDYEPNPKKLPKPVLKGKK